MSFYVRGIGWCCTTEEDAAGAKTPAAAFDRITRLAYFSFLAIHLREPDERDRNGRLVIHPWEHVGRLRAMKEMVTLTGEAIHDRRAWEARQAVDATSFSWDVPEAQLLAEASARHQPVESGNETSGTARRDAA